MKLGAHCSAAGGAARALARAKACGCEVLQLFTKNSNQWRAKPLSKQEVSAFRAEAKRTAVQPVMAHASYLINLCSEGENRKKSLAAMVEEVERCEALGVTCLVVHPGARLSLSPSAAYRNAARLLRQVLKATPGYRTRILLENTAGQGSSVGSTLEDLEGILALVADDADRLGVCLDTCHTFAAGYPIHTEHGYEAFLDDFARRIGFSLLQGLHLNDSKRAFHCRVDRHAPIGKGYIGQWLFWRLLHDERLKKIPAVLETPPEDGLELHESFARQLSRLRRLAKQARPPKPPAKATLFG